MLNILEEFYIYNIQSKEDALLIISKLGELGYRSYENRPILSDNVPQAYIERKWGIKQTTLLIVKDSFDRVPIIYLDDIEYINRAHSTLIGYNSIEFLNKFNLKPFQSFSIF